METPEIPQVDIPNEVTQVDLPEIGESTPHPQTTDPQAIASEITDSDTQTQTPDKKIGFNI